MAGEPCVIGSRDAARAQAAAVELAALRTGLPLSGAENADAARQADTVFICVPYAGHRDTLAVLRPHMEGKVLVDVVAPLAFAKGRVRAVAVEEGSAAEQAQALVPSAKVVGAFHNLSAEELMLPDRSMDCDVVVCADDAEAKRRVTALAEKIKGVRAVNGGPLECSRYVEQLTALLISINRVYKTHSSVRITGV
jgi:NADPH-dependent F420 reductase